MKKTTHSLMPIKSRYIILTIVLIALGWLIGFAYQEQASATYNNTTDFKKMAKEINFTKQYLKACVQAKPVPACEKVNEGNIKANIAFLVNINTFGSIDLPGTIKGGANSTLSGAGLAILYEERPSVTGGKDGTKVTEQSPTKIKISFLSNLTGLINDEATKGALQSKEEAFRNYLSNIDSRTINNAADKLFASCQSMAKNPKSKDSLLCAIALSDNGIFADNHINEYVLTQLYKNAASVKYEDTSISATTGISFRETHTSIDSTGANEIYNAAQKIKVDDSILPEQASDDTRNYYIPGGLGWLLDMILTFTSNAADGMYGIIEKHFLEIKIELFSESAVQKTWQAMRTIANSFFAIIFLIIVLSHISGRGLSNYNLKKMIPKLIIGAVLINLSFFITQIVIDLSNIIGKSLYQLLLAPEAINADFVGRYATYQQSPGLLKFVLDIILMIITSILVLISCLINIILFNARDAALILLVVFSPICLVASIMPQTKQLTSAWWKSLLVLAFIFPIVAMLVGGGTLVHNIIIEAEVTPSISSFNFFIIAKLAMFGSLIVIPFVVAKLLSKLSSAADAFRLSGAPGSGFLSKITPFAPGNVLKKTGGAVFGTQINYAKKKRGQAKLQKMASRTGRFWSESSLAAQDKINKQYDTEAEKYNQSEATKLIEDIDNGTLPIDNFHDKKQSSIRSDQSLAMPAGGKNTPLILAKAIANDKHNQHTCDPIAILKALNLAKSQGASQFELKTVFNQIIQTLAEKNDFRSIGVLNAALDSSRGSYGIANIDDLEMADSSGAASTRLKPLQSLISKHTEKAIASTSALTENKMKTLNYNMIDPTSAANTVFLETLKNDPVLWQEVWDNRFEVDTETRALIPEPPHGTGKIGSGDKQQHGLGATGSTKPESGLRTKITEQTNAILDKPKNDLQTKRTEQTNTILDKDEKDLLRTNSQAKTKPTTTQQPVKITKADEQPEPRRAEEEAQTRNRSKEHKYSRDDKKRFKRKIGIKKESRRKNR